MSTEEQNKPMTGGERYRTGNWQGYWTTGISYVEPHKILVRGYRQEELFHLSYPELLYLTVRGELPNQGQARVLEAVLVSMPDHYFVASHTPAARFTASANPNPISAIAASILTMGANTVSPQDSGFNIRRGLARMQETGLSHAQVAAEIAADYIRQGKRIPGLGHPTHSEWDSRSDGIWNALKREGMFGDACKLYHAIRDEYHQQKGRFLVINVDGAIACGLYEAGFEPLEMAGIGALAVMPGIIAHVMEEIANSRVGLRFIPEALGAAYNGPAERSMPDHIKNRNHPRED